MIIVTDAQTDVDDIGAISLAANSRKRVYGLISSTNSQSVAGTLLALDKHYDLDARIGLDKRGETFPSRDPYSRNISSEYPTGRKDRVIGASRAIRKALRDAKREGEKIPVVSIGSSATLERFRNGRKRNRKLIRDSVSGLHIMAGNFEDGSSEFNVRLNPGAANSLANRWPTRVTYAGFELGRDLLTGEVLRNRPGPVRRAYELYPRRGVIGNERSYDAVAVAHALGAPGLARSPRGRVSFTDSGLTSFSRGGGNRRFLRFTNRRRLRRWINKRLR